MKESMPTPNNTENEEISLKDLILKLQESVRYLLSKWLIIVLFGIFGAGIGLAWALLKKPVYVGELTFVLEEGNKSGGLGAYAGLASQFGFDLGSMGNSNGLFSGENILEFLKSRLMVEKTLLIPVTIEGKTKSLAEYYLDFNKARKKWKPEQLLRLTLPANVDRSKFSLEQDSLLNSIYEDIVNTHLKVTKPDKKLSFISVKCNSYSETFSKEFTNHLVDEATAFYINTKTKRSKANVDVLQEKADSIERLLNKKTYSAAAAKDLNLNPARSVSTVAAEVVTRDKVVLQTMYAEVVKNLELSRMSMAQETPIIQLVDTPILPLKKEKLGKIKGIAIGGFLGAFLVIIFLGIGRLYRNIME